MRSALPRQLLLLDDVDRRVRGRARDGLPPNVEIVQRLERVGDLGRRDAAPPSGIPFAMPLAIVMMSGSTPVVLDAPELAAGAAEAGLHLVADEDAAVLPDDVDGDLEVLRRRRDEAADALDRLGEEAGDPARSSSSGSAPRCPSRTATPQDGYVSLSGQR